MEDNTNTQADYKRGDAREDGMIFWKKRSDRMSGARWLTPEKFATYVEKDRAWRLKQHPDQKPRSPKRVTVPTPKHGDVREDGYRFQGLNKLNGREHWYSPEKWDRYLMRGVLKNAKKRAAQHGWECNLTVEHLLSIYPKDGLCPLSKEPMVWGTENGRNNSPSIDRIDCSKGYVSGNVWFISAGENLRKSRFEKALPPWVKVFSDGERVAFDWTIERPAPAAARPADGTLT